MAASCLAVLYLANQNYIVLIIVLLRLSGCDPHVESVGFYAKCVSYSSNKLHDPHIESVGFYAICVSYSSNKLHDPHIESVGFYAMCVVQQ